MADNDFTVLLEDSAVAGGKQDKKSGSTSSKSSAGPAGSKQQIEQRVASLETPQAHSVSSMDDMFNLAREWVGHPYLSPSLVMQFGETKALELTSRRSNSQKRAIDCSGFAQEVLGYAGVDPPGDQTAEGLYKYFKSAGTSIKTPDRGALVFFEPKVKKDDDSNTWDAGRSITHVALSLGGGKIMDASGGRGVTERSLPPAEKYTYHYIMPSYKFGPSGVS